MGGNGFSREPTNPGFRIQPATVEVPGEPNGWLDRVPLWVKVIVGIAVTGSVPAGVASFLPFETKEAAEKAHTALEERMERLEVEIPKGIVEELKRQGFVSKRR